MHGSERAGREQSRPATRPGLGLVWRETGAVRNARPSRGQAASTRKRTQWDKLRSYLANEIGTRRVGGVSDRSSGRSRWRRREHTIRTQQHQKSGRIMVFLVSDIDEFRRR